MDYALLWAGIAIGAGTIWGGIGIWLAGKGMLEALSRNPELEKKYMIYGILAMALAEATAIYALVISILLYMK